MLLGRSATKNQQHITFLTESRSYRNMPSVVIDGHDVNENDTKSARDTYLQSYREEERNGHTDRGRQTDRHAESTADL